MHARSRGSHRRSSIPFYGCSSDMWRHHAPSVYTPDTPGQVHMRPESWRGTAKSASSSNILHASFGIVLLLLVYLQVRFYLIVTLSYLVMLVVQIRKNT
ncbi:hypothetical protein BDZ89DRAFT_62289 [Hymenopellis radicata]|nr:hypothetical protein BDZ89DRAFT_62289 [Hymenopellis radicata]